MTPRRLLLVGLLVTAVVTVGGTTLGLRVAGPSSHRTALGEREAVICHDLDEDG